MGQFEDERGRAAKAFIIVVLQQGGVKGNTFTTKVSLQVGPYEEESQSAVDRQGSTVKDWAWPRLSCMQE